MKNLPKIMAVIILANLLASCANPIVKKSDTLDNSGATDSSNGNIDNEFGDMPPPDMGSSSEKPDFGSGSNGPRGGNHNFGSGSERPKFGSGELRKPPEKTNNTSNTQTTNTSPVVTKTTTNTTNVSTSSDSTEKSISASSGTNNTTTVKASDSDTKKLTINEKCIGCGHCVREAAKNFAMNSSHKAEVISQEDINSTDVSKAISRCPVDAISIA